MIARATVIIPTFGQAEFAVWSIKSVQAQTIRDIEICIICDGSPENMVSYFRAMAEEDPRIRVFLFPKGPRTGEVHRDVVIRRETKGRIICYCAHDDLWLPNHVEEMEKSLISYCFAHTIHANINTPERIKQSGNLFNNIGYIDLANNYFVNNMLEGSMSCFGLTNGAHTRESYLALKEGWVTTPQIKCKILIGSNPIWFPTDLYMWNKFLSAYPDQCLTNAALTAIHFPISYTPRREWSEGQRYEELGLFSQKIQDPVFIEKIRDIVCDFYQCEHEHFSNQPCNFDPAVAKKLPAYCEGVYGNEGDFCWLSSKAVIPLKIGNKREKGVEIVFDAHQALFHSAKRKSIKVSIIVGDKLLWSIKLTNPGRMREIISGNRLPAADKGVHHFEILTSHSFNPSKMPDYFGHGYKDERDLTLALCYLGETKEKGDI